MSIPLGMSGLREQTVDHLVLDAGVAYVNGNASEADGLRNGTATAWADAIDAANTWVDPNGDTVAPRKMGATRGGFRIQTNRIERQIEADGKRLPTKGLSRIDGYDPRAVGNLLEVGDKETLKLILGGGVEEDWGSYIEITPRLTVEEEDYLGNLMIAATVSGTNIPVVVLLDNPRAVNPTEIPLVDNAEAVVGIEFVAHALLTDPLAVPIHFFWPAQIGS